MREVEDKEYNSHFIESSTFPYRAEKIHEYAYKVANDNRKFEINNYWKRANYYWLFQASVYAGYFYSITTEKNDYLCKNPEIIVGVTCLGFLTALAWYLSNKGSKQWQKNWENHVFMLEDSITGPLYKTTSNKKTWSVSKINEIVSLFSVIAWIILGTKTVQISFGYPLAFVAYFLAISLITSIFCFFGRGLVKPVRIQWFKIGVNND